SGSRTQLDRRSERTGGVRERDDRARTPRCDGLQAPHLTVSVPFIPAASCPGTEQKNVYLPGFRFTVAEVDAPVMTLVPPRSWPSGESLVKSIVTGPALGAVTAFCWKASWPLGSALIFTVDPPPPAAVEVAVVELVDVDVVDVDVVGVVCVDVVGAAVEVELG